MYPFIYKVDGNYDKDHNCSKWRMAMSCKIPVNESTIKSIPKGQEMSQKTGQKIFLGARESWYL